MAPKPLLLSAINRDPIVEKNQSILLDFVDSSLPEKIAMEEWGPNAITNPHYYLKCLSVVYQKCKDKLAEGEPLIPIKSNKEKKEELKKAYEDIRSQVLLLAAMTEQERMAKATLEAADPKKYNVNKGGDNLGLAAADPSDEFKTATNNFTNVTYLLKRFILSDVQVKFNYTKGTDGNADSLEMSLPLEDIPSDRREATFNRLVESYVAICKNDEEIPPVEITGFNVNDYKYLRENSLGNNAGGVLGRWVDKNQYVDAINSFAICIYSHGLEINHDQFKELDEKTQKKCLEIQALKAKQAAEGAGYAASAGITGAGVGAGGPAIIPMGAPVPAPVLAPVPPPAPGVARRPGGH